VCELDCDTSKVKSHIQWVDCESVAWVLHFALVLHYVRLDFIRTHARGTTVFTTNSL
jgi:hypothetical protein